MVRCGAHRLEFAAVEGIVEAIEQVYYAASCLGLSVAMRRRIAVHVGLVVDGGGASLVLLCDSLEQVTRARGLDVALSLPALAEGIGGMLLRAFHLACWGAQAAPALARIAGSASRKRCACIAHHVRSPSGEVSKRGNLIALVVSRPKLASRMIHAVVRMRTARCR